MDRRSRWEPVPHSSYPRRASPPRRDYEKYDRHFEDSMPPRMRRPEREPEYRETRERERMPEYSQPLDKEDDGVLYFSDCIMYPPRENRDKPVVPRTPKPNGCKTIYLGGIPEVIVRIPKRFEAILAEVFHANGGEIDNIRISGRGFCHIRFMKEDSIDKAMSLSGYWMEVKQGYEPIVKFRIMADFSENQLDAEEYESKQLIANRLNLPDANIPKIPLFTAIETEKLMSSLKSSDGYADAIVILRYWMNTSLNKQTSVRFFNILQASSVQIKRLQSEKKQLNDEYDIMMGRYEKNVERLDKEFDHLMNLYEDAHKQKSWDNFTKPQRKSIDSWLENVRISISTNEKGAQRSRTAQEVAKNMNAKADKSGAAKRSEVKEEHLAENEKSHKINELQESLDAMQKQVWEMVAKLHNKELELQEKQSHLDSMRIEGKEAVVPAKRKRKEDPESANFDPQSVKLMCALTPFLLAYPKGATMECMEKFLRQECKLTFNRGNLETKLLQMSDFFSKHITMENNTTVTKWKYVFMT